MIEKTMSEEKVLEKIRNRDRTGWYSYVWIKTDPDSNRGKKRVALSEYMENTLRCALHDLIVPYLPVLSIDNIRGVYVVFNMPHVSGKRVFSVSQLQEKRAEFEKERDAEHYYMWRLIDAMAEYLRGEKRISREKFLCTVLYVCLNRRGCAGTSKRKPFLREKSA